MEKHIPVLLNETIDGLNIKPDGIYLDFTIGRGGHSSKILSKLENGFLIGFDQDEQAIKESNERLAKISHNFKLIRANFKDFDIYLKELNIDYVDGILMDLGVSSPQFDDADRGFSYKQNAKLDMRMDQRQSLTAYEIVNNYSLSDLTRIFKEYGEDKYSYSIAKNIVKERENRSIETTFDLFDIIKRSKPEKELHKIGHPAKQIFQALRIAVNNEIEVLKITIDKALKYLKPHGGRLAIITFHSGEDKIVKSVFKENSVVIGNRIDGPNNIKEKEYSLVNQKPIIASSEELENNHRAISAKLRIIERK